MSIQSTIRLFGLAAFVMLVAACENEKTQAAAPSAPPAAEVGFVTLQPSTINLVAEMPGRTVAFRKADVRPQVDGIIKKRSFTEGAYVEAGQQLYQIDKDRYQAELDSAQAELARERANLELATKTRLRYEALLKSRTASEQSYDDAVAAEAQSKAAIAAAQAGVDKARIELNYTNVVAPLSGQIGASTDSEGALVTASQAEALATITQLDPIYVDVTQAGGKLLKIKDAIAAGRVTGLDEANIEVRLVLDATGQKYPLAGKLEFSDVTVNETTGSVRLRAVFPNPDKILLPGMFVRGYVDQGRIENAYLVPQRAVMRRPDGGAYVYLVGDENKVLSKDVTIEQSRNEDWVVTSGIEPGGRVIVDGLQRIAPGMTVTPKDIDADVASSKSTKG
ncbi:efflux RND transporter periplasmic adaptor subunit [uncultured Sneathiella sp.]|uniref:efflux RND transporter periplasmic adaptor subunit n=1 Tax=uncultured Sneathiella sp. TaxID=879315 RepID=UPI0030ED8320